MNRAGATESVQLSAPKRSLLKEVAALYVVAAPKISAWLEEAIPQGLTIFNFPLAHQKRLRTSNPLERVNQELKRRTRVFANEPPLGA